MPSKIFFPPLEACRGTRPIQAENSLPFLNSFGFPITEAIAVAGQ